MLDVVNLGEMTLNIKLINTLIIDSSTSKVFYTIKF